MQKQRIMNYKFYSQEFSKQVKTKRVIELNIGLREVAKKSKVSAATLSRIENGNIPDMESLLKVCKWLQVSPSNFFISSKK